MTTDINTITDIPIQARATQAAGDGTRVRGVAYSGSKINGVKGFPHGLVIDLSSLSPQQGRVPLQTDHRADFEATIGSAEYRVDGAELIFSASITPGTPTANRAMELRRSGGFSVSVGYHPERVEHVAAGKSISVNGREFSGPLEVARGGRLREISVVGVGADPEARAVAAQRGNNIMDDENNTVQTTPDFVAQEEARIRDIRATFNSLGEGGQRRAQELIEAGASVDQARGVALTMLRSKRDVPNIDSTRPETGLGAPPRQVLAAWLVNRVGLDAGELVNARAAESADRLRCNSLVELCGHALRMDRRDVPGNRSELIQMAFSTTSLPGALSDSANKVAENAYTNAPSGWRAYTDRRPAKDFKSNPGYRIGWGLGFDRIANGGELKHGSFTEEGTNLKVETFGSMSGMTRQDIINDDLGLLQRGIQEYARAAARRVADEIAGLFANPGTHYSTANNNLLEGAAGALGIEGLSAAVAKMRDQKDINGRLIDVVPRVLLVPASLETVALRILNGNAISETGSTDRAYGSGNPFRDRFELVVDPRLDAQSTKAWYLLGAPADAPVISYWLDGRETPTIEIGQTDFARLGIQMRGYLDFGVGFGDFRTSIKVTGEEGGEEV